MIKRILYLFLFIAGAGFRNNKAPFTKWVITQGCSLKVDGSTNVNTFSCAITNYSRPDTIAVSKNAKPSVLLNGRIRLDVQNFDCHNPMMTADLRKTLKAKDFPHLTIRFISIGKYPEPGTRQAATRGNVTIELAGVTRQFEVNYKVVSAERDFINLVGFQKVHFSDFNITPPRKLGGMIRTNNELSVVFDLRMKVFE